MNRRIEKLSILPYFRAVCVIEIIYDGESNENLKFVIKKSKFRAIIL